ncbi:glycosyl hydrolase family 8 [Acuticoccus sp. M5D2P5]|uniref:glycosyl hydrolase family 8 n=1 Tax=Acuticoccus kalidii TaxID=2910977 RepID=UPI001F222C2F|nr:glycosyl hydrolase family 8 [Acuticoccus kalidii]MCF3932437.1 glycosyl hydrolase family 8 [Acuticoccus kalidii]
MASFCKRLAVSFIACVAALTASTDQTAHADVAPVLDEMSRPMGPQFLHWYRGHFSAFRQRYMRIDGRIVDPENGGVTHSEAQAYGMLIAFIADEPVTFEQIWRFTKTNLRRPDDLFAWRYMPERGVTDWNNATDADLLIASTLALAAKRWNRGDYLSQAIRTAGTIGRKLLRYHEGQVLLMPAIEGFDRRSQPDGPVVNLSYYNFDALRVVGALAPRYPFERAADTGVALIALALEQGTLSDWNALEDVDRPTVARKVEPHEFGYNAIRIGYNLMAREGPSQQSAIALFHRMNSPYLIRRTADGVVTELRDPGYRIIADMVRCEVQGTVVDPALFDYRPTTYFASALHLMAFGQIYQRRPWCLPIS